MFPALLRLHWLIFLRALFNDTKQEVPDLMSQLQTSCPSVLGGGGGGTLHKGIPKSSWGLYPAMVAGHPLPSVPTTNVSGRLGAKAKSWRRIREEIRPVVLPDHTRGSSASCY